MYKILLITTSRCEACNIAKSHIIDALKGYNDISLEIKDRKEVDRYFLKENKVKDFPTTIYMIDNKVVSKSCGTYPMIVYKHWIKLYFRESAINFK